MYAKTNRPSGELVVDWRASTMARDCVSKSGTRELSAQRSVPAAAQVQSYPRRTMSDNDDDGSSSAPGRDKNSLPAASPLGHRGEAEFPYASAKSVVLELSDMLILIFAAHPTS